MSALPQFIRRMPQVFYALAVVFCLWRFWNEYAVLSQTLAYESAANSGTPLRQMAMSGALYWAFAEAAYMVGTGVMIQVLIAIFDKVKGAAE
ncbi:hypothetical protein [Parerythrobacter lacustris]|uniref:Sugar ABC transporter permease n=1 Tax=Parerythrobacter lacustris TaxID=2969984 RepID=A0ABT1XPY9_9SPHN|nr:hypothetical protein [Parerythrobacter lacustris]MCR2833735.1 hypothetical protein [Parerythrobacter lacustris]